jgi:mRNA interferase MazF
MKKGDLVLIPFPFTDLTGAKKRPELVLVSTDFDVTVSFITSQIKWSEEHDIIINPSLNNGLKIISLIRLSKVATIKKELVIGKLGELSQRELTKINRGLIALFELGG